MDMVKLFAILVVLPTAALGSDLKELTSYVAEWEGFRATSYRDTTGHLTIGYGFNLDRNNAESILGVSAIGYRSGLVSMSKEEAGRLLAADLVISETSARKLVANYDSLPKKVRMVVVDMAYNLGEAGLRKFVKFRAALGQKNFSLAAAELVNSNWYRQVKRRGVEHVKVLQEAK